jgi:hypothetical protein
MISDGDYYYGEDATVFTYDIADVDEAESDFDEGTLTKLKAVSDGLTIAETVFDQESFESSLGDWYNDSGQTGNGYEWERNSGSTWSSGTGPSGAYDGSYYVYVETSSLSGGEEAILAIDLDEKSNGNVDFYYHQYGDDQGTLYLEVWDGDAWNEIWSSTGDQGDQWNNESIEFEQALKIRFRNVHDSGGAFEGDIALDLITINTDADSGTRVSPSIDLSSLDSYKDSIIKWTSEEPGDSEIVIEARYSTDGGSTWSDWHECSNDASLPSITNGLSTDNTLLECRQTLSVGSEDEKPTLNTLEIYFAEQVTVTAPLGLHALVGLSPKYSPVEIHPFIAKIANHFIFPQTQPYTARVPIGKSAVVGDVSAAGVPSAFEAGGSAFLARDASLLSSLSPPFVKSGLEAKDPSGAALYPIVNKIDVGFLSKDPSVWWGIIIAPAPGLLATHFLYPTYKWLTDPAKVQTIYQFMLTGSADGETDITIPIASCQMRRRDGKPTYMSVVVPDYDAYADEILARPNGEMVFYKGVRFADDSIQVQEIARVDMELENLRMDKGPKSRSITVVGHKTVSTTDPNVVTLSGASYRNYAGGTRRYRCDVDLWLRPGDTAVIEGQDEQFQVGYISYTIGIGQEEMEIVEVEE